MTPSATPYLRESLLVLANSGGGGWGYYPGTASRIEPTCWTLVALGGRGDFDPGAHWRFLRNCQRPSGFLVEDVSLPPNIGFNAMAAVTMLGETSLRSDPALLSVLDALVKHAGLQVAPSPHFRQDNSLRGWPWIESTFSWVEPTSWALLALKRAQAMGLAPQGAASRIEEAERMLVDRCCRDGGWNYGNANALGKDLYPYVPVTALALLAMQNRRELDAVVRSLRYLQNDWPTEPSAISLGLTSICLRRFGIATDKVDQEIDRRLPVAMALNNIHALSVALYATTTAASDDAFTV